MSLVPLLQIRCPFYLVIPPKHCSGCFLRRIALSPLTPPEAFLAFPKLIYNLDQMPFIRPTLPDPPFQEEPSMSREPTPVHTGGPAVGIDAGTDEHPFGANGGPNSDRSPLVDLGPSSHDDRHGGALRATHC